MKPTSPLPLLSFFTACCFQGFDLDTMMLRQLCEWLVFWVARASYRIITVFVSFTIFCEYACVCVCCSVVPTCLSGLNVGK